MSLLSIQTCSKCLDGAEWGMNSWGDKVAHLNKYFKTWRPGDIFVLVKWVINGSGKGFWPVWYQVSIWHSNDLLSIGPSGTNFGYIYKRKLSNKGPIFSWSKISLKCVPPIDNKSSLIQCIAWHRKSNKLLSEPTYFEMTFICPGVNELKHS